MANITIKESLSPVNGYIGAIICRTPKSISSFSINNSNSDGCELVLTGDELVSKFGDPYIDPKEYTALLFAKLIVDRGFPIYISSVDEMKIYDDDFNIKYNGYTDYTFYTNDEPILSYKIKSNIKFCQPVISSTFSNGLLTIKVILFYLDRRLSSPVYDRNTVYQYHTYTEFNYTIDLKQTDTDLIELLNNDGLELLIDYIDESRSLVDTLRSYSTYYPLGHANQTDNANLHNELYEYDFDADTAILRYSSAIDNLYNKSLVPDLVCLSSVYHSIKKYFPFTQIQEIDPSYCRVIHNYLQSTFVPSSGVYLFINTPDMTPNSVIQWLNSSDQFINTQDIINTYNCDIFFNKMLLPINSSLVNRQFTDIECPTALLAFASSIISINESNSFYTAGGITNLNIAYSYPKIIISETTASLLSNLHCNSLVNFDTESAWIYGDTSLSLEESLKKSHVSRVVTHLDKILKNYFETKKFSINTDYNLNSYKNYITYNILQPYTASNIIYKSDIQFRMSDKHVYINVDLWFYDYIDSINLEFVV